MARRGEGRNVALSDGDNRDKVRGSQKEHINHSTQNESPPPPPLCTPSLHAFAALKTSNRSQHASSGLPSVQY